MRLYHVAVRITGLAILAAVAACSDTGPTTGPAPTSLIRPQQAPDMASLTRALPGFGGLFVDHGVPTVYLTDLRQQGLAEQLLGGFARARGAAGIRVLAGRFAYGDLDKWFQQVSNEAFAQGGVVFVDLDEAANRVLVGVEPGASHANIRALAARLGVPAEALTVRDAEPIRYMATLRDQVRAVVAGLQINFSNFLCSIGFNATSGGQASFVTASHCTDRQGGVEGTLYYQPLASTANSFIGTEVADPKYFRGAGCPKARKCRFSDASRAAYAAGVPFTLGGIAATSGPNNGSITIAGTIAIRGEGSAIVGDVVNKIGRTTGWTQGVVSATCVNTGVSGTNIVQLCQTFVDAGVGGGDSGSDVFALSGGNATLLGDLWGGNSTGTMFVYSPIANIEQELGPLTTF
ncbi:MAG TPA: hypothetical protein VEK83_03355 [Gemmatimonadales bacterium]|nr:hypothetical protein [Gemmatimonadales bacterium]